jgi:hypothetical protein
MDHTQREIRNEIEATRAGMVQKIATLEDRVECTIQGVKRSVDPKYQTERHPWIAVGLSVAAGYLLSGLILGKRPAKAELVLPDDWQDRLGRRQSHGILQNLMGMLSGAVTATAVSFAREYASGLLFKRKRDGRRPDQRPDATSGQPGVTYSH